MRKSELKKLVVDLQRERDAWENLWEFSGNAVLELQSEKCELQRERDEWKTKSERYRSELLRNECIKHYMRPHVHRIKCDTCVRWKTHVYCDEVYMTVDGELPESKTEGAV